MLSDKALRLVTILASGATCLHCVLNVEWEVPGGRSHVFTDVQRAYKGLCASVLALGPVSRALEAYRNAPPLVRVVPKGGQASTETPTQQSHEGDP